MSMSGATMSGAQMSGPMWMPTLPPTLGRLLAFHLQPLPIVPALALLGLAAYVAGVVAARRRGVRWPWWRLASWLVGVLVVVLVTSTGIEGYGMLLFSVHMVQHMCLAMVAPIFLLLGSPVTLALRALPSRGAGSGARRQLVRALGSRWLAVLTSIPVRWLLFLSGLYGIYFTSLFDALMSTVWGHNAMLVHFLGTGLLFFGPLVRADPWPGRSSPLLRMVETFASTPFHAFFGIAVMSSTQPVVGFFAHPPRSWHVDVLADQGLGGGIAWGTSEIPTMLVMGIILVGWFHSDQRDAARHERTAVRTDDAELRAYNARLAGLAALDRSDRA